MIRPGTGRWRRRAVGLVSAFQLLSWTTARAEDVPTEANAKQEPAKGERVVQEADRVIYQKKTVVDFGDVTVEGSLTRPEGAYALSKRKTPFKSLLKLRENFEPELQRSVDSL